MSKPGLRTKLNFRFNTEDMEFPDMDFLVEDPVDEKKEIKVVKKKRRRNKKENKNLF